MHNQSNSRFVSHWELVELAERLMAETPHAEHFLPAYDAALAADGDAALVGFCRQLSEAHTDCVRLAA